MSRLNRIGIGTGGTPRAILVFACAAHFMHHVLVSLYLTLVLTLTDVIPGVDTGYTRLGLDGAVHLRYILLDLGPDHNLLIEVSSPDEAHWSEFVAAAMPVIESFEIGR